MVQASRPHPDSPSAPVILPFKDLRSNRYSGQGCTPSQHSLSTPALHVACHSLSLWLQNHSRQQVDLKRKHRKITSQKEQMAEVIRAGQVWEQKPQALAGSLAKNTGQVLGDPHTDPRMRSASMCPAQACGFSLYPRLGGLDLY